MKVGRERYSLHGHIILIVLYDIYFGVSVCAVFIEYDITELVLIAPVSGLCLPFYFNTSC